MRRVSERGFKSDFNLRSHGGAIKNSEGSSENATSFHDGIQDAEITCLLKTMRFQMHDLSLSISQPLSFSVSQSLTLSVSQSLSLSVCQSFSFSIGQPLTL